VHPGGAAALYGVTPDLITLGKIIGGGLPVGAFGGRRHLMQQLAPGRAGLSGGHALRESAGDGRGPRHLARARGRRVLRSHEAVHLASAERLDDCSRRKPGSLSRRRKSAACSDCFRRAGASIVRPSHALRCRAFKRSSTRCSSVASYLAPSAYEAGFVSAAHGETELATTLTPARPDAFGGSALGRATNVEGLQHLIAWAQAHPGLSLAAALVMSISNALFRSASSCRAPACCSRWRARLARCAAVRRDHGLGAGGALIGDVVSYSIGRRTAPRCSSCRSLPSGEAHRKGR